MLLALFLVRAVFGQVFPPATRAAVPALVGDQDLPSANAALGFGENGLTVLGPVLAAALFTVTGIRGLLFIDAAAFLLCAFLLLGLPPVTTRADGFKQESSFLLHAVEGITFLLRTVAIRLVYISFVVVVFFNAVDDVALVFLGRQSLHASNSGISLLYAGSTDATIRLWDLATGRTTITLTPHGGYVVAVAFSPDGRILASASTDDTVRLWDPATGQATATLFGHTGFVTTIAFSPDGHMLATGSRDRTIRLWTVGTALP